jgi:hypothetical protein
MRFRWILPATVLMALACGSFSNDLDTFCTIATDLENDNIAPEIRDSTLASELMASGPSGTMVTVIDALASASPEIRYELLQKAAKEEGVDNWECPALERWWAAEDPAAEPEQP